MALKLRRGLSENLEDILPAQGELIYTIDTKRVYVGDGSTPGHELTPLGSGGGGGSSIGIDDTATSPVLILSNSLITSARDTRITGDLTVSGTSDATIVDGVITADSFVGAVTGNLTGNVIGNVTGTVSSTEISTPLIRSNTGPRVTIRNDGSPASETQLNIPGTDEKGAIFLSRESTADISSDLSLNYGSITFERNDLNGEAATGTIIGRANSVIIGATATQDWANVANYLTWKEQKLGVGNDPAETLDVQGNAIIRGTLTADNIVSDAAGTPEISSASDIIITANSGAGNFEVDSAKLLIDDVDLKAKLDLNIEGVVMMGKEASNDPTAFVPAVVNAPILSGIANDDTLDGTDRVKEVFRYRVDRYSSGGEILLAINDYGAASGADQFLIKKFLFHDSAGDGSAWTVTEIGTSGNAGLFTSLTVGLDNPGGGIDFFLTFTLRSPDAAISSASMIVTGQTSFTSNPLTITVSGY